MPDRHLTDQECLHIVAASLDPDRVLGGPDGGNDDGETYEPDILLVTVEAIVRRHRAEALREAETKIRQMMSGFPQQGRHTRAGWALNCLGYLADEIAREIGGRDE